MATPEFYAGHWEVKTYRSLSDQVVVPVSGTSMTLIQSGTSGEKILFSMAWRSEEANLDLAGLEYIDGKISGERSRPDNPRITSTVCIAATGEKTVEVSYGPWPDTNALVGMWGAEKAGNWLRETPPVTSATPVPVET